MTAEKVITSDDVQKRTENITTGEEFVKVTDEVHKRTDKITTNKEVDKGAKKLEYMKEAVVTIRRKDSDKFEGPSFPLVPVTGSRWRVHYKVVEFQPRAEDTQTLDSVLMFSTIYVLSH